MPNTFFQKNLTDVFRQSLFIVVISIVTGLSVNMIRTNAIPFFDDWSVEGRLALDDGESLIIPLDEAASLFEAGKTVFLDARDPAAYDQGHIQGALNLPWHSVDDYFADIADKISRDSVIITYCDGESCNLSHDLALFLKNMGFDHVKILVNGWTVWQENRLPIQGSIPQ